MRKILFWMFAGLFLLPLCARAEGENRAPAAAGSFYPASETELRETVDKLLGQVLVPQDAEPPFALIVPHAGYVFSGPVAAYGYKTLQNHDWDSVIIIGPSHFVPFGGASVWESGAWQTPLGSVEVDSELASAIAAEDPLLGFPDTPHREEHSVEVQIPFLQRSLKSFKIVPIVVGDISMETSQALARAIVKHMKDKKVLIVISTDMSHYYTGDQARAMDRTTLALIEAGDTERLYAYLKSGKGELCGAGPVLAMLEIAKLMDWQIRFLKYAHSGDMTGDNSRVVGYGAFAFGTKPPPEVIDPASLAPLTDVQKKQLLEMARHELENMLLGKKYSQEPPDPRLELKGAAFVTLRKNGELRGCIGHLAAKDALSLSVLENAVLAATRDPRFPPVRAEELKDITIEISVLSPPRKGTAEEIMMGRDGVILSQGGQSGVFLPEVAKETNWSKEEFLSELCSQKAGLAPDCWKDPKTTLEIFTAENFSEEKQGA